MTDKKPVVIGIDPGWDQMGWAISCEDRPLAWGTQRFPERRTGRKTMRDETDAEVWARRLDALDLALDRLELRLALRKPTAGEELVLWEAGGVWSWAGEVRLAGLLVEGMPAVYSGAGRGGRKGGVAGNQAAVVGPLERQGGILLGWARRGLRVPAQPIDVARWRKWWQIAGRAHRLYGSRGRDALKRAAVQLVEALAEQRGWGPGFAGLSPDEAEAVLISLGGARRIGKLEAM